MRTTAETHPDICFGAGPVTTPRLARQAVAAGARFCVSPCLVPDARAELSGTGTPLIEGGTTPTEVRGAAQRSDSAARKLFAGTDWAEHITGDLIHLSGITLQIASASARRALSTRLRNLRPEGTLVSFDTNYRPSGWGSPQEAVDVMDRFAGLADIVLASWDDETALHDSLTPEAAAQRPAALGPCEVIVKTGADGAHLLAGAQFHHTPAVVPARVLDTTAAGDAFAGACLAARITDRAPTEALRTASRVAAVVVAHPGAITPASVPLLPTK